MKAPAMTVPTTTNLEDVPTKNLAVDPPTGPRTTTMGIYFLWYTFTIGYNVTNNMALSAIDLPWSIGAAQLAIGSVFVLTLLMLKLRNAPRLSIANIKALSPIAACHVLSHACAHIGLGDGAVSFVRIVRAAEPLFTAFLIAVSMKQTFSPLVYLTLVLVVVGVSLASLHRLDFKWLAYFGAVASNLATSTCAILSKRSMGMEVGNNMDPANFYAVVHIMASAMLLPLALVLEGPRIRAVWGATFTTAEEGFLTN
eukprot:g1557.t1